MKKFLVVLKSFILSRITIIFFAATTCLFAFLIVICYFNHSHFLEILRLICRTIVLIFDTIAILILLIDRRITNSTSDTKKTLHDHGVKIDEPANEAIPTAKVEVQSLLVSVGTVAVAATKKPFVAKDNFVVNTEESAPMKISYLGKNFKEWFLKKTEAPFAGSTLTYGKLSHFSIDGPIIKELGGDEKAETTLTELFGLMEVQRNGKKGSLLTNGYANIFYVKDSSGVLRAVDVHWYDDGWGVGAVTVTDPDGWGGDDQVFFRDSR